MPLQIALNHMTVPGLDYAAFLRLALRLGCVGVEVCKDLARPLFDDAPAATAGRMARDAGLRLLGISQVQPFNDWSTDREREVAGLIATARAAGAESLSLIPRNDGTGNGERHANLRIALKAIGPMLADAHLVALVEPLGFTDTSLRDKRGLVDADDRLGNIDQRAALIAQGYDGPVSMACFATGVHALTDPEKAIRRAFDLMSSQLAERATCREGEPPRHAGPPGKKTGVPDTTIARNQ
jgi:predicted xylose isomerase-like sugar epimerase